MSQAGQEGYLDVFLTELEAFKGRVREHTAKTKGGDGPTDAKHQATATPHCPLDPKEVLESLPPVSLPRCFPSLVDTTATHPWSSVTPRRVA